MLLTDCAGFLVHRVKSHLTFLLLLAEVSLRKQLEDLIRKYYIMAVVLNIGAEKNGTPFSATTKPMYQYMKRGNYGDKEM